MVEVRLGVEEDLHVADVEAELRDARLDQPRGAGVATVDEDVPLRTRDEKGRDVVGTDVIEIAGDAEWFYRLLPAIVAATSPARIHEHGGEEDECEDDEGPAAPKLHYVVRDISPLAR